MPLCARRLGQIYPIRGRGTPPHLSTEATNGGPMSNISASDVEKRMKAVMRNELVTVRYQIANVERAIDFYTRNLGFTVEGPRSPAFATVALGNLRLLLSGPGSSGARPMPSGQKQEAGGWNRILVYVEDLEARIK